MKYSTTTRTYELATIQHTIWTIKHSYRTYNVPIKDWNVETIKYTYGPTINYAYSTNKEHIQFNHKLHIWCKHKTHSLQRDTCRSSKLCPFNGALWNTPFHRPSSNTMCRVAFTILATMTNFTACQSIFFTTSCLWSIHVVSNTTTLPTATVNYLCVRIGYPIRPIGRRLSEVS